MTSFERKFIRFNVVNYVAHSPLNGANSLLDELDPWISKRLCVVIGLLLAKLESLSSCAAKEARLSIYLVLQRNFEVKA